MQAEESIALNAGNTTGVLPVTPLCLWEVDLTLKMNIAVAGCTHGCLDRLYAEIARQTTDQSVDLLLCTGDFEAIRDQADLDTMMCPAKFRTMGDFVKYYRGECVAPVLTVFIGGNHEAVGHLAELEYGGWVAPNIYYLGRAGVIQVGTLRIAGLSGVFQQSEYDKPEVQPPYKLKSLHSSYKVRRRTVDQLLALTSPIDVFMSHDWPRRIYHYGDTAALLRAKPFLNHEVKTSTLGSPASEELMGRLRPKYWFASHMHVKYAAVDPVTGTKFLSLDKVLDRRNFLQILRVDAQPGELQIDEEWAKIIWNWSGGPITPPSFSRDLEEPFNYFTSSRLRRNPMTEQLLSSLNT
jgi:lariat debranching enzyme